MQKYMFLRHLLLTNKHRSDVLFIIILSTDIKTMFILTSISSLISFSDMLQRFCVCATLTSARFLMYLPSIFVLAFISCSWSLRCAIISLRCCNSVSFSRRTSCTWRCSKRTRFRPSSSLKYTSIFYRNLIDQKGSCLMTAQMYYTCI